MNLYDDAVREVQTSAQEAQALLHKARPAIAQFEELCRVLIQQGLEFLPQVRACEDELRYSINIPSRHYRHAGPLLAELDAMHCTRTKRWGSGGIEAHTVRMADVPDFDVFIVHPVEPHELVHA